MRTSIECTSVTKAFNNVRALNEFSVRWDGQGISAIIGPNGAGKTTLLNVLSGFVRPDRGEVRINGHLIGGMRVEAIPRLGLARTFQTPRVYGGASVLQNVVIASPGPGALRALAECWRCTKRTEGVTRAIEAVRALRAVDLADVRDERAGNLSFGQQKLLALACCLATGARILLLDEPVAGVHPELVTKILDLLGEIREAGKLIIFIEHDLAAVRQIADRVIVMDEGHVIADGIPADVLARPEIMEAYVA